MVPTRTAEQIVMDVHRTDLHVVAEFWRDKIAGMIAEHRWGTGDASTYAFAVLAVTAARCDAPTIRATAIGLEQGMARR